MVQAFITYNENDSSFVDQLYYSLNNQTQLKIVFDKQLRNGSSIFKDLFESIGKSDFLLAILSRHSIDRKWVQAEIRKAGTKEIQEDNFKLIPIIPPEENFKTLQEHLPKDLETYLKDIKFCRFDSQDYNTALQELVESLTPKESSEELYAEIFAQENKNPFWRVRAENFTDSQTFVNLFEGSEKTYDYMISPRPVLMLGGRGSGKTMLLRSMRAPFITSLKKVTSFNDSNIPYFGVYHRASSGTYSIIENTNKIDSNEIQIIFMDQIILRLGQSLLSEIKACKKNNVPKIDGDIEQRLCKIICRNLRLYPIELDFDSTDNKIREQIALITDYIRNKIRGFNPEYIARSLEKDNLDHLCKEFLANVPELNEKFVCFLIDEYENFTQNQKIVINTLVKFHDASSYTFKIASKKTAFNTSDTLEGQPLQEIHDYDLTDIDFDISKPGERKRFGIYVSNICKKIMLKEGFNCCDIKKILEDSKEIFEKSGKTIDGFSKDQIMNEIKKYYKSSKNPWNSLSAKQLEQQYAHYRIAAEYRLRKPKAKSYAGFDDFITFSSGNIRIFVELCGMSYILATRNGIHPKKGDAIPSKSQIKALEHISNYYLWDIQSIPTKGRAILRLINDLGILIREKLLTHVYESESSLISIKDPSKLDLITNIVSTDKKFSIQEIFETCVMYSVFHEHSEQGRRAKSGFGVTSSDYILNRIYAQALKISPRPMFSFSISCTHLKGLLNPDTEEQTRRDVIMKIRKTGRSTQKIERLESHNE